MKEQSPTPPSKEEFTKMLDEHDWHYGSSDDMRVWDKGSKIERQLHVIISSNEEFKKMYEEKMKQVFKKP